MSRTTGLLVMAYGTARRAEDIEAFYTDIRHGSRPSPELLAELNARYRAIGGLSPLAAITAAQGEHLERCLNARFPYKNFKTYLGYKHAAPFIEDAVAAMHADGIVEGINLVLAPHYSGFSVQGYNDRALQSARKLGGPVLSVTPSWYRQPKFIRYWATRIEATLAAVPAAELAKTVVVFSAHSLPQKILQDGDPYVQQIEDSARLIAAAAKLRHFVVGWQSAGRTPDPWIGPDVRDLTRQLWKAPGYRRFVYCPIGFVADHLEVLYDNDIECRDVVAELGGTYVRPAMPNTDPLFIECLADVVAEHLPQPLSRAS